MGTCSNVCVLIVPRTCRDNFPAPDRKRASRQQVGLPEFPVVLRPRMATERKPPEVLFKAIPWRHFKRECHRLLRRWNTELGNRFARLKRPKTVFIIRALIEFPHQPAVIIVITELKENGAKPDQQPP